MHAHYDGQTAIQIFHHDRQDTFISETTQPFFHINDARHNAEGQCRDKGMIRRDSISNERGKHDDHQDTHEDQLPLRWRSIFFFLGEAA